MIIRLLKYFGIAILLLVGVLLVRTFTYKSKQVNVKAVAHAHIDEEALTHLSEAIQFKTVSSGETGGFDSTAFSLFIAYLTKTYPRADSVLHKQRINGFSLLYTWKGKNPNLKPIILIGHMDVVPALADSGEQWTNPAFSGAIKDGAVWGRGSLDDKISVIGILEAVEMLLKEGFAPERTTYLAFGHDEEIGGHNGAQKIAAYLLEHQVKAEFLLDEGLVITSGIVPGIEKNVALIGTSEKGYATFELSVAAEGGHSSMPAKETPIGILSAAVSALEKHPMKSKLSVPVQQFLDYVGPEMPFFSKIAFANRWLFAPLVIKKYENSNAGRAIVRTTTAPTIFRSGTKDNVLPGFATATINFRILPGETVEMVKQHIQKTIKDERVAIKAVGNIAEPSPVSEINNEGFKCLEKSIRQIFPNTLTAPSLVIAGTDARHYTAVAENQYRFVPLVAGPDDLTRIHGVNEKMSCPNFMNCICFYRQLILNFNR
jgi:carboxypeptidase PM20D1